MQDGDLPVADQAIYDAVRELWEQHLGRQSFAADISWEKAGGDSLKALELLFFLESKLGRTVPMEVLTPTTRPSQLIARIAGNAAAEVRAESQPRVYLILGSAGIRLDSIRFVEAMADRAEIKLVDYPPYDMTRLDLVPFERFVEDFTQRIDALTPPGEPIHLLGRSFGAYVAFETARRLQAAGRTVALLGLLDASPVLTGQTKAIPYYTRYLLHESFVHRLVRVAAAGRWASIRPRRVFELLIERQLQRRRFALLGRIWRLLQRLWLKKALLTMQSITELYIRAQSLRGYEPTPATNYYSGRVCVFKAEDPEWDALRLPDDLGWREYCREIAVWRITGSHLEVFSPANVDVVKAAIADALATVTPTPALNARSM
jgi:thioesterase domain-containing protein/acyl carrier protein